MRCPEATHEARGGARHEVGGVGWVRWAAGVRVAEGLCPARFRPAPRLGSTQLGF